jgi:hypothetical protein
LPLAEHKARGASRKDNYELKHDKGGQPT